MERCSDLTPPGDVISALLTVSALAAAACESIACSFSADVSDDDGRKERQSRDNGIRFDLKFGAAELCMRLKWLQGTAMLLSPLSPPPPPPLLLLLLLLLLPGCHVFHL